MPRTLGSKKLTPEKKAAVALSWWTWPHVAHERSMRWDRLDVLVRHFLVLKAAALAKPLDKGEIVVFVALALASLPSGHRPQHLRTPRASDIAAASRRSSPACVLPNDWRSSFCRLRKCPQLDHQGLYAATSSSCCAKSCCIARFNRWLAHPTSGTPLAWRASVDRAVVPDEETALLDLYPESLAASYQEFEVSSCGKVVVRLVQERSHASSTVTSSPFLSKQANHAT
ncbi:hypothetical protein GQ600_5236 [Phytophthora cactorum]|nr:hypothetical protein GQ600_5236 [Phytophthora cactorum]